MKKSKYVLMMVATLAIGIFALPSTLAMFGGQHNWYNLNPRGSSAYGGVNDIPCEKCHADIYEELSNSGAHKNLTCAMCHRATAFTGITFARGNYTINPSWPYAYSGSIPGEEAHAASSIACMDCHGGMDDFGDHSYLDPELQATTLNSCSPCHSGYYFDFITAGGFGLTGDPDLNDTGEKAAHLAFVLGANQTDDIMERENEACIACHTHVAIDINWTHKYKMYLEADGSSGDWTVGNFLTEGTYNVTTYGNMSGENVGATDPVVKWDNGTEVANP